MPNDPTTRVIRGQMPTSNYAQSTSRLVRGPSSNKTAQYLESIDPNNPGQQGFYREALTGIPHPLEAGKTLSYGGLQDLLAGPHGAAARDAYSQSNRMQRVPTKAEYEQAAYAQAHADLLSRGANKPGELAFPMRADAALRAPNTATAIAHGNYVLQDGQAVVSPESLNQRYEDVASGQSAMTAPGMPAPAMPVAETVRRVIRGSNQPIAVR